MVRSYCLEILFPSARINTLSAWVRFFDERHSLKRVPRHVRTRLRLFQLVGLFISRIRPDFCMTCAQSLIHQRDKNDARLVAWEKCAGPSEIIHLGDAITLSTEYVSRTREPLASGFIPSNVTYPRLGDLLPLLVDLIYDAESNLDASKEWMRLMGQWMLQAVLEEFLVFTPLSRAEGSRVLAKHFSYGKPFGQLDAVFQNPTSKTLEKHIRKAFSIFTDKYDSSKEADGWSVIRKGFLDQVRNQQHKALLSHNNFC
jgi:hypothetical protein